MDRYLAKILELGLEEGESVNLNAKQTKEMINQKLQDKGGKKKKKRGGKVFGDNDNGMTEEELIAEQ